MGPGRGRATAGRAGNVRTRLAGDTARETSETEGLQVDPNAPRTHSGYAAHCSSGRSGTPSANRSRIPHERRLHSLGFLVSRGARLTRHPYMGLSSWTNLVTVVTAARAVLG